MRIQNAKPLGKYAPPRDSDHARRAKQIHVGTNCDTGEQVRFYERSGTRVPISAAEWQRWRKISG